MSVRMIAAVWDRSAHAGNALLMLLAIADFADDEGRAFPSVSTLAKKCRCGWPATRRCDWHAEASGEMRCDAVICTRCTLEVAPDRDLCPKHAGLHRDQERGRAL